NIEAQEDQKYIGDPGGFCVVWSIWYVDNRLTYYDVDRKTLINEMIRSIDKQNISYKELIRNYSINITQLRDKILKKSNLTINEYTEEQIYEVAKNVYTLIVKYN